MKSFSIVVTKCQEDEKSYLVFFLKRGLLVKLNFEGFKIWKKCMSFILLFRSLFIKHSKNNV